MSDPQPRFAALAHWLGMDRTPVSPAEKLVSALGGFLGILGILLVSHRLIEGPGGALIVASMGASAVLLFAVPHGPLSQPWALVGGHGLSAIVGVTCANWIGEPVVAASLAVGIAIGVMHLARCIHPPGGATALAAVVSGPAVHQLGYGYLLTPVMLNVTVILGVALAFNYLFPWRRYPVALARRPGEARGAGERPAIIEHADLVAALAQLDTYIDIDEQDLLLIYDLATRGMDHAPLAPEEIRPGHFYSNGRPRAEWQVREVLEVVEAGEEGRRVVSYLVADGRGRGQNGKSGLLEFARWARFEVVPEGAGWRRLSDSSPPSG